MGLDITVHIGSKPCTDEESDLIQRATDRYEAAEDLGLTVPFINPDFLSRASDLTAVAYRDERTDGLCAGAYSRYNRWREGLALLAGVELKPKLPDGVDPTMAAIMGISPRLSLHKFWCDCEAIESAGDTPTTPFWQLLHFSDCEGALGPTVCKALAEDFDRFSDRAAGHLDEYWRSKYDEWRHAFRQAADSGGWIAFH